MLSYADAADASSMFSVLQTALLSCRMGNADCGLLLFCGVVNAFVIFIIVIVTIIIIVLIFVICIIITKIIVGLIMMVSALK